MILHTGSVHKQREYFLNNYQFKLVKAKREFVWHSHEETDEMFFVVEGRIQLPFRDKIFELRKGELIFVPKWTLNTGKTGGPLTDTELEWISLLQPECALPVTQAVATYQTQGLIIFYPPCLLLYRFFLQALLKSSIK